MRTMTRPIVLLGDLESLSPSFSLPPSLPFSISLLCMWMGGEGLLNKEAFSSCLVWQIENDFLETSLFILFMEFSRQESVHPKGNQPWIFIGRTDAEAEAPILWPPEVKSRLIGRDPDVGKDWGQEEKEVTEDEMVGWHHQLTVLESEQTWGDSEGQGSLQCAVHEIARNWRWLSYWTTTMGLPWQSSGWDFTFQCRRCVFNPRSVS